MSTIYISNSTENQPAKQCRAAVKEFGRIFCTTFLSLVPPLSLLLFARLSAIRHQTAVPNLHNNLYTKTTSVLGFPILAAAVAALAQGFAGDRRAWLIRGRRRLHGAVVWIFSMQVCLNLWIYGFVEVDDRMGGGGVGSLVSVRSLVLGLGLCETVVFWRRDVVKPAVEEAVLGLRGEEFNWVENVVLAAAFGCMWWRRLRREAEELVVMRRDVELVDVVGWLLYGSTAAVGGATVVKGLWWAVSRIFRRQPPVIGKVRAIDNSLIWV
ncbi:uncharacterized protein LOC131000366 [Salvia miltiorrhiza]|uniref:uncharacterized protein LOC131000366 n=1 Tax=Salvia miltiorrhiza TaxID=226208 RepID=UPI0025AD9509|nr:uncharacterized protein LOC131000366 [Salvia miltiorrhiza]